MTTLDEIEAAIRQLPSEDVRRLATWLQELDQQQWDEQFARDVAAGKLDGLAEEAIRDFKAGQFRTM